MEDTNRDRQTVLIVEDLKTNRKILHNILDSEYNVVEAENGDAAFVRLDECGDITAILLDIIMPVMDGYAFLEKLRNTSYSAIPVIAVTGDNDAGTKQKALQLGAWDFVSKPYRADALMLCLKNVIIRSQVYLLSEMRRTYEYDALTGLFNRSKFFEETKRLLEHNSDLSYALMCFDIDQSHLLNSFWGEEEVDRFLSFIADALREVAKSAAPCTFSRISTDTFCICEPYNTDAIALQVAELRAKFSDYNKNYLIEPSFGVYVITDKNEKIQTMLERATLAAKECKDKFMSFLRYYNPEMSLKAEQEQMIVSDMHNALETGQFQVYLQPKYNLKTEKPYGAEALIRWQHPEFGLLLPGMFIPIFERNGFIGKIDYYMWEKICAMLRKWLDEGLEPAPISVNVSRVNMYNPNLVSLISNLVKKYNIPPRLLNLELTESAYMDNPDIMGKTVLALQKAGFTVMMDDFGSGYSSLNTLKDIPINVLKIDMQFLSGNAEAGRKECIMAAVVHMASWLGIPVIMEGVETSRQVSFLKSIGCGYVQGYYFAKPMPVPEYEALVSGVRQEPVESLSVNHEELVYTIWSSDPHIDLLFNSIKRPAAVYQFENGFFRAIRVNSDFIKFFGYGEEIVDTSIHGRHSHLSPAARATVVDAFMRAVETRDESACEYELNDDLGATRRISLSLRYWGANESANILFALFFEAD
ncbi:MAG: EAL domain-containing protein [Oscillospiraceae bacterium]|nr:EAL domain-containing protein [Oscillospiraceae bacterium]